MLLTVITVCYQAERPIEETIRSLLRQTVGEFEYLVVDGSSTDRTLAVVEHYRRALERKGIVLRVISEPDKGLYDAMNKGIRAASGTWIEFLNAGTFYVHPRVLERVTAQLERSDADVVCCDAVIVPTDGRKARVHLTGDAAQVRNAMPFVHEAVFLRRVTHTQFQYDLQYPLAADYDMFLRTYLAGKRFSHCPVAAVVFREDGLSAKHLSEYDRQCWESRLRCGVIKDDAFHRWMISSGACGLKARLYMEILPRPVVCAWEEWKALIGKCRLLDRDRLDREKSRSHEKDA